MPPIREIVSRHRGLVIGVLLAGVALLVFVLVWFEPQKLFVDETVDESAPVTQSDDTDEGASDDTVAVPLSQGAFVDLEHDASGKAVLLESEGKTVLRFENFRVENGPDLVVYLSAAPADAEWRTHGEDFVDLGELKGNIGDQNYEVPAGTDLEKYKTAVIWCRRFTVPFAAADLA